MKAAQSTAQPGLIRASGRKRHNRALREEQLTTEAARLGIAVQDLKTRLFQEVQDIRRHPPQTPDWARPAGYREIVR